MLTINGKTVDESKCFPLVVKDFREMSKLGIDFTNIKPSDIDSQAKYLAYILSKGNPEVTIDDVDTLLPAEFAELITVLTPKASGEISARPLEDGLK